MSVPTVNEHLRNLYEEGELVAGPTIRNFRIVRPEGSRAVGRNIEHYNLAAILAVGYRVRSPRDTQFRRWATERLGEYLVKGVTMDDERADHSKPNMGLTTWKGAGVRKADVVVAKNHLGEDEIGGLNRIVVMWLDYAEDQARRRKQVFLRDWEIKLDEFLSFNERRSFRALVR